VTRLLGVDVGGTNIKTAVVEHAGDGYRVVARSTTPTWADEGPLGVLGRIAAAGREAIAAHGPVAAAGVGVPGLFDTARGEIVLFSNLPGPWRGVAVRDPLQAAWGIPVAMINDARALTLAETRMGAAAGAGTVVCVALGTGVGGGVVVDGRLRFGPDGRAGEIGHQVIVPDGPLCGAGCRGCVESLAAAPVLARRAGTATAAEAVAAARQGDPRAAEAVVVTARYLGQGIAAVVNVLHPDRVVVGGGVAEAGDVLLAPLRRAVHEMSVLVPPGAYDIVPAALGPSAGSIGAALWAAESQGRRP
jgi:glucokinase